MCIFSQPVISVSDTSIFARLGEGGKQYLVYEMRYQSKKPNAMILPLPVKTPAAESSIQFIDPSKYGSFFKDLALAFPPKAMPKSRSWSLGVESAVANSIKVHKVGNFIASFVPTVDDFDRLDEQFVLPKSTWDLIPEYSDYGFAVFQLSELVGKPHPIAFEFKTRSTDKLFFPTMHIHDGEVHKREEFDHSLFLQHPAFDASTGEYNGPNHVDRQTQLVRSKRVAASTVKTKLTHGIVDPELLLHRMGIKGKLANKDVVHSPAQIRKTTTMSSIIKLLPFGIGFGAIAWLINRRNTISQRNVAAPAETTENPAYS